ncbi:MAG: PEP-CTERM sorting domain-containing protein [Phycisphaerales bacterium]|nr:MAG: PEP-CTERM sorting domain-containing protein [Phycisphaerales bacterium]
MSSSRLLTALVILTLAVCAEQAPATSMLMTKDGYCQNNIARAQSLGHDVTEEWLEAIEQMSQAELAPYGVVFVSPRLSTQAFNTLRSAVADGGSLQQYVASGGILVLNVAANAGNQNDVAPGGVDYQATGPHDVETFLTPGHPYITGAGYGGYSLVESDFDYWGHTDHGHLTSLPGGATSIIGNVDGVSLAHFEYGSGDVLVGTLTIGWAEGGEARGKAQYNMIQYAAALVPEPSTIGLLTVGLLILTKRRRKAA